MEVAKKYYIYARKSSEAEDKQILSIESQLRELSDVAKKYQVHVIGTYFESKSAKELGREKFADMVENIEKGIACGILTWHPDRLSRNAIDSATIIDLIDR